jgi:hypothetical protein
MKMAMAIRSSTRRLQVLVTLAALSAVFPAAAEEQTTEPSPASRGAKTTDPSASPVNVVVEGVTDGVHVRVLSKDEGDAAKAQARYCTQDCELKLPTGSYTLIASRGEQQRSQDINLTAPLRLTVNEPNATLRDLGTVLGITGIVLASLGTFVTVAALTTSQSAGPNSSSDNGGLGAVMIGGFGIAAAGAGLIAGGFSLAAANRAPSIEVDPLSTPRLQRAPSGAVLSFTGRF